MKTKACLIVVLLTALALGTDRAGFVDDPGPCGLLKDPVTRAQFSGALEIKLMQLCGEITQEELSWRVEEIHDEGPIETGAPDANSLVNDPGLDVGGTTQSETSIVAIGETLCAAWNDSGEGFGANGFSGFGVSLDGGLTFSDGGAFPTGPGGDKNFGDPSLAFRVSEGAFYYAALSELGLSLWKSTNNCQSFVYVGPIHIGSLDDKELIAADNAVSSPYFGRIHVGWTDFSRTFDRNLTSYSDDGGSSWSSPVALQGTGNTGQGMSPAVAPNGEVYFALTDLALEIGELQNQLIYKSIDGGESWTRMTDIGSNQLRPENIANSAACGRQALSARIRNLSSPQIAIHPDPAASVGYVIHAVYPYDSDGVGPDESNVFYRRSTDGAMTWSSEIQLNDDATVTDQWFPAIAVSDNGNVAVSWYDRRLDPTFNVTFDRFAVVSEDGGLTWGDNVRVSDVSSGVSQNLPHFDALAPCYHGDYDQLAIESGTAHILWSDDRRLTSSGPNPDVYHARIQICAAPDAPDTLTATAVGDDRVDLVWSPSAGAASYNVYRSPGGCPASAAELLAGQVPGPGYLDIDVVAGTTYAYFVTAVDSTASCESAQSNCASIAVGCGNGNVDGEEQCDGGDLGGATCADAGCTLGLPACTVSCTLDFSVCGCCLLEINPVADGGNFSDGALAYDDDTDTAARGVYDASQGAESEHYFSFAPSVVQGQIKAVLSTQHIDPGIQSGRTEADYSLDGGASFVPFASTSIRFKYTFFSPHLGEVDLSQLWVRIRGIGDQTGPDPDPPNLGIGISNAWEIDFVADNPPECLCDVDADCGDGVFCNGQEVCLDGVCHSGPPPCVTGETCRESIDSCEVLQSCPASRSCGRSCRPDIPFGGCPTQGTGEDACLTGNDSLFECPAGTTIHVRNCECVPAVAGAFCPATNQSWGCE